MRGKLFYAEWLEWVRSAQKMRACFPASGHIMGLGVCRWITGDWFWLSAGARRLSFGSRAPFGWMRCWETLGHVLPLCYNAPPPPFLHLFAPYVVYRFAGRSLVSPIFLFFQPKFHRSLEAMYRDFVCLCVSFLSSFYFFFWLTLLSADLFRRASSVALQMVLTSRRSARHNKKYFSSYFQVCVILSIHRVKRWRC